MEKARKSIKINSFRIAYREWGDNGIPVILLHGIPMNSSLWLKTGEALASYGYRVLAPELLGLGYTEGPVTADHSLKGQSEMIRLFIKNMFDKPCILVGHDVGGGIAQILFTDYPELFERCVLTNCVAFDSWPVEGIKTLSEFAKTKNSMEKISDAFIAGFLSKGLPSGTVNKEAVSMELVQDILNGLTKTADHKRHFIEFLRACDNSYTKAAAMKFSAINKPVTIVWAKSDVFQPVNVGEMLYDNIPESSFLKISGGHFHPLENTELADCILNGECKNG